MRYHKSESKLTLNRIKRKQIRKDTQQKYVNQIAVQNDAENIDYQDLLAIINEPKPKELDSLQPVHHPENIGLRLKELYDVLQTDRIRKKTSNPEFINYGYSVQSNEIDPELRYRFLNRYNKKVSLPQINTRMNWQNGESPFFKIPVQFVTLQKTPFINKHKRNNNIRYLAVQDTQNGDYKKLSYPENMWANSGTLFITNQRIFFKRTKNDSFYIIFDNILNYNFYANALTIEHISVNEKKLDAFYIDEAQARLLETIIHITL